ncbi:MAG TPA: helix-turn-helix domain-containing protein [Bryobacteraceae bacterium]|nr:helix-turn-helix domain-containing protein [Bryobacteraceae bacterium]
MEAAISAQAITELDLVEARRNSGISLAQISETTRISMRFLEAIEAGAFEKLPGGVFAINYVRQYARCIGLDEQVLVERCKQVLRTEPAIEDIAPLIEAAAQVRRPVKRGLFRLPIIRVRIVWTAYRTRRQRSVEARAAG